MLMLLDQQFMVPPTFGPTTNLNHCINAALTECRSVSASFLTRPCPEKFMLSNLQCQNRSTTVPCEAYRYVLRRRGEGDKQAGQVGIVTSSRVCQKMSQSTSCIWMCCAAIWYKNLAIANRSRVSGAHNTSRAFIGLNITLWPWNLSLKSLKITGNETIGQIIHDLLLVKLFNVKYYRDLEMWVRCHSRSLKVVPFESLGTVSYP